MVDNRTIRIDRGDYREVNNHDKAQYAEGDIINSEAHQKTLTQAAAEIQQLLEQLDATYETNTVAGKMEAVTAAVKQIDENKSLRKRLFSAGRAAAYTAIEKTVEHPLAAPVVAALKDWNQTKK
ncbi:MAG: hypothetical protein AAGF26_12720 [Cyanobacteria bacterium P01_G01_bin.49]